MMPRLNKDIQPKLTLVGAGPGDPDLISIKGTKALGNAKVVLYDALIHPKLLDYVPDSAIKIFVGKRAGQHSKTQDEINRLIVEYAHLYGSVLRLKGGDPFVFGRGQEEVEYAKFNGITTEIIPGISSSTSLTSLQGIPLTSRGLSRSFWVLTGTTKSGELSKDLFTAAQTNATVVILMGVSKLKEIMKLYQQFDKPSLPVAVIQNGSTENEKVAIGTVNTIVQEVRRLKIGTPAIIVVGEVVRLHPEFIQQYAQQNVLQSFNQN